MLSPRRLVRRLRALVSRRTLERDLDDELRLHLELETRALIDGGMEPGQARETALREFGGVELVKEDCRDERGVSALDDFARDLQVGARGFRRTPGFTMVALATIALGIGGTTAIFGAVHGILLAPLPYRDAERVITVWQHHRTEGVERGDVSPANLVDWRERSRSWSALAAAEPYSMDWQGPDGPEHLGTWRVSEGFFEALGTAPLLGRAFTSAEYAQQSAVVMLGYDIWQRRFAADPATIGRTIVLDGAPYTIVGVMPRGFHAPPGRELWAPKMFGPDDVRRRGAAYLYAIGRLAPNVGLGAARAEMATIADQLAREYPRTNADVGVTLVPIAEETTGRARSALLMLMGAVALVLLIACANVAGLLLARAARRDRELALRVALGAGRGRVARQLLAESLILAVGGGVMGLALAQWGLAAIRVLGPQGLPRIDELRLHPVVLAFAGGLTIACAFAFGVAPALHAARADLHGRLVLGGRTATAGTGRRRLQRALVIAEMALALVLLVGAGLLGRSFAALLGVDRGFDPRGVLGVAAQTWSYYPTSERRAEFARQMEGRLRAIPGIRAAGLTSALPFGPVIGAEEAGLEIDGRAPVSAEQVPSVRAAAVTSGYFEALRIPLREGRVFQSGDDASGAPVALVSASLARRWWPGESPVGRRIRLFSGGPAPLREVVGVVGDIRHGGLDQAPRPTVYVPHAQSPTGAMAFVIAAECPARAAFLSRGACDTAAPLAAVQREFRNATPAMPLAWATPLEALLSDSLRERRFHLALLGAFAGVALLLAAVGIYGVMSHVAGERTHEIGIRMALGARTADVLGLVLREGVRLACAGAVIGAIGAAALTRLIGGMLYGVTPLDPITFALGAAVLLAVALVACWLPARRAAGVDPVRALREE